MVLTDSCAGSTGFCCFRHTKSRYESQLFALSVQRLVSLGGVIGTPYRITGALSGRCLLQTNTLTYRTQSKYVRHNKCKMWGIEPHLQPFPDPHCHYANLALGAVSVERNLSCTSARVCNCFYWISSQGFNLTYR